MSNPVGLSSGVCHHRTAGVASFGIVLVWATACSSSAPGGAPPDVPPVVDVPAKDVAQGIDAPVVPDRPAADVVVVNDRPAAQDVTPVPVDVASSGARLFPADAPWNRSVMDAPLDAESASVIAWLDGQGWGLGRFQIDFSLEVLEADASAPVRMFTRTGDFYSPDCDFTGVPVPAGGVLEGETGYQCLSDGDCHLIVVHRPTQRLFEMWRANITPGEFRGGCLAVWDLTRTPPPQLRGENCTSADAAGLPIAPLTFSADEVAAGSIDHAVRFILPNARIRNRVYVRPATHSTGATSGPAQAPPYGARLRLRRDYPLNTLPNEGSRVLARALQRYGMILADGGNVLLTARSDRTTRARWANVLGPRDLQNIRPRDFEMVDGGTRYRFTGDCVRTP